MSRLQNTITHLWVKSYVATSVAKFWQAYDVWALLGGVKTVSRIDASTRVRHTDRLNDRSI